MSRSGATATIDYVRNYPVTANSEAETDFAARVARERPELAAVTREAAGHFADLRYGTGRAAQLQQLKGCTRRLPSHRRKNV